MAREPAVDRPEVVEEVRAAFDRYERALLANDIDTLDAFFWRSPSVVCFGPDTRQQGWEEISAHRRSLPYQTLPRTCATLVVTTFGADLAVVTTEFLPGGSHAVGRQSQTWARLGDGWRVVSAHVSWQDGIAPS